MLVPPPGQRIIDVDQLLGCAVEVEPAVGIAINLKPGGGQGLLRTVAHVEPCALQSANRSLAQARLGQRPLELRALLAALGIVVDEARLLQPEPELDLAELGRLEAG